jgi:hypothetical protein
LLFSSPYRFPNFIPPSYPSPFHSCISSFSFPLSAFRSSSFRPPLPFLILLLFPVSPSCQLLFVPVFSVSAFDFNFVGAFWFRFWLSFLTLFFIVSFGLTLACASHFFAWVIWLAFVSLSCPHFYLFLCAFLRLVSFTSLAFAFARFSLFAFLAFPPIPV